MNSINDQMLKEKKWNPNIILIIYFLKLSISYNYDACFENKELTDTTRKSDKERLDEFDKESLDISNITVLERDKKVKEGKGLKMLTQNKLLTRLPILLAQTKTDNYLDKLKNEIRQILYLLYQHNKITKNVFNNLIKSL